MKRLSDYQGEEAIELWGDLLIPIVDIVGDPDIGNMLRSKTPVIKTAQAMIKSYSKQVCQILLRIDPTPINGVNILTRLVGILTEMMQDETIQDFLLSHAGAEKEETSTGPATETTEAPAE